MASPTILPLKQLNVAQRLAQIRALQSQANSYSVIGLPVLPGVPNIPKMTDEILKSMYSQLMKQARA